MKTNLQRIAVNERLSETPIFGLLRLRNVISKELAERFGEIGQTVSHWTILTCIEVLQPSSQREISEALGFNQGDLVARIDDLDKQGLINRSVDPNDRRRNVISVTRAGAETANRLRAIVAEVEELALACLANDRRAVLTFALKEISENLPPIGERLSNSPKDRLIQS